METTERYKLTFIDSRAATLRGIPPLQVQRAELIVGKDNRVLKDLHGTKRKLTDEELRELKDRSDEVLERQ